MSGVTGNVPSCHICRRYLVNNPLRHGYTYAPPSLKIGRKDGSWADALFNYAVRKADSDVRLKYLHFMF